MESGLYDEGDKARDEGIERVSKAEFQMRMLDVIISLPLGSEVMAEDWRRTAEGLGVRPHHTNAWGAVAMYLVRMGIVTPTGEYRKSKRPEAHSRRQAVYRVT